MPSLSSISPSPTPTPPTTPTTTTTTATSDSNKELSYFLYGVNIVKTKYDTSVRRGAIVKAMCIFSKYQFIDSFKKPLDVALESYFKSQSLSTLKAIYECLHKTDVTSLPRPNIMEQFLMRRGIL